MRYLVLLMIVGVTVVEFLAKGDKFGHLKILPSSFAYFPELISCAAALVVIVEGARSRFVLVRPAYWLLFGSFLLVVVAGIISNHVDAGPIFAGIRNYMRGLPWFFLAAVVTITNDDLRRQLRLLLVIVILQLPLAIVQRIRTGRSYYGFTSVTGDWTSGTMLLSGTLSVFLICAMCIAVAMYERKLLTGPQFLFVFLTCLIPTTINETKVSIVLLPVAVLVSFICAAERGRVLRRSLLAVAVLGVAGAIFVPVYNSMMEGREYGLSLGEFFLDRKNLDRYVDTGKGVGAAGQVGRLDAIVVPTTEVAKDPVTLTFGLGIGNASESALGDAFTGTYGKLYKPFLTTSYSRFMLELGALGVLLLFAGYFLVVQDSRAVAASDKGIMGAFAAGWVGVTAVIVIASFYLMVEVFASLGFLYWYFSGVVMAERMRRRVHDEWPVAGAASAPEPA